MHLCVFVFVFVDLEAKGFACRSGDLLFLLFLFPPFKISTHFSLIFFPVALFCNQQDLPRNCSP